MENINNNQVVNLTKEDFVSDQIVKWCPGCGDHAILKAVEDVFPKLGKKKEDIVVVSGIGCSSRFPYYMNTYGFHSIHGRAAAIATGVKLANPNLSVWVITGDGDCTAIGGNHFIHAVRRNIDMNLLLFNNRIYGLTKGQFSPCTFRGTVTKTSPQGTYEDPFNVGELVIGAGGKFFARGVDVNTLELTNISTRSFDNFYIFNLNDNQGWVIISGDDAFIPVLGYSKNGRFETDKLGPNTLELLKGYEEQIQHAADSRHHDSEEISKQWKELLSGESDEYISRSNRQVYPLIQTKWDQSPYYNYYCPYDATYDETTVTGCVATAMAQIMNYWEYPKKGEGIHSYNHERYGTLFANFGATYYDWTICLTN